MTGPNELILTREQLTALTGVCRPTAMVRWLEARGWMYEPAARRGDIPKVSREYFNDRMSGRPTNTTRRAAPRLDFFSQR